MKLQKTSAALALFLVACFTAAAITFDEWRETHFTETEMGNPAVSGETADPDGDGRGNYLEFALDTDPKNIEPTSGPQTALDATGRLTLTFTRWSAHPGLLYAPLVGSGLNSGWFAGSRHVQMLDLFVGGDGKDTLTVRDLASSPHRFIKLMIATDSDGDGLPDSWELELFGDLDEAGSGDFDLDGLSNLYEWEEGGGRNAADYYNGVAPTLSIADGNNQQGPTDSLLPVPLSVQVRNTAGIPLENAPVTFTVTRGFGEVSVGGEVRTNAAGIASADFYTAPMDDASIVTASATVVTSGAVVSVTFTETSIARPAPPEGVNWEIAPEGNVVVRWTDASATETAFVVERTIDDGTTWQPAATVGANISQVLMPAPGVEAFAFRVQSVNATGSSKKVLNSEYGSRDDDDDGLDNQEEMDEDTDKNNPDCDGDGIKDGDDASPFDPEIIHPRVPRAGYVVIDLTDVGLLPGDTVLRINDLGQIIGYGVFFQSFIWDDGVRTELPLTDAYKLNNLGQVIGSDFNAPTVAAKWSPATGFVSLPIFNPPLAAGETIAPWSTACGLNDAGTVVGSGASGIFGEPWPGPFGAHDFYYCGMSWNQSTVSAFGPVGTWVRTSSGSVLQNPDDLVLVAEEINNSGVIVGDTEHYVTAERHAFVSTGGATVLLPKSQPNVSAWDINDGASIPGGQTVVFGGQGELGTLPHDPTMWVHTASGWKDKYLGRYNPATGRNAYQAGYAGSINDRLEMTGWFEDGTGRETGQLWQNGKVRNLNEVLLKQGWLLRGANHINNLGAIIGRAVKISGPGAGKTERPVAIFRIRIVPDEGMAGVVGDVIPSNNRPAGEKHFVSPKKTTEIPAEYVEIKATGVSAKNFKKFFRWEGAEEIPGDSLRCRVSRNATTWTQVKVVKKAGDKMEDKMNVWIVWCDVTPRVGALQFEQPSTRLLYYVLPTPAGGWRFVFTIQPPEIISNPSGEWPDLRGEKKKTPPGYWEPWPVKESKSADTAVRKWDVSRQMKVTIKNPGRIPKADLARTGLPDYLSKNQPIAENQPVGYPEDPVEGNDDADSINDENGDPYNLYDQGSGLDHEIGQISSSDAPLSVALNLWGAPGRSFADFSDFKEFARVQLWDERRNTGVFWFRISDHFKWRFNFQAAWNAQAGEWQQAEPPSGTGLENNP